MDGGLRWTPAARHLGSPLRLIVRRDLAARILAAAEREQDEKVAVQLASAVGYIDVEATDTLKSSKSTVLRLSM